MTDIVQLHSIDCTSNNQSCGKFPRLFCETNFSILHHVECVYWLGYFNASVTMIMMQKQVDRPRKKEDGDAASRNQLRQQEPINTYVFFKMANFQSCISIITMPQPWSHKAPPPLLFSSTASEFSRFTNRLCQCGDAATMSTLGKCRQIDPKFQRTECYKWNPFWRNQTKQMYVYFEGFHY